MIIKTENIWARRMQGNRVCSLMCLSFYALQLHNFYGRKKFGANSGLFAFFRSHVSLEKFNFAMQISIASSPNGTRNAHLQRQFICLVLDVLQRGLQSRISIEFPPDDGNIYKQTCLKDFEANAVAKNIWKLQSCFKHLCIIRTARLCCARNFHYFRLKVRR